MDTEIMLMAARKAFPNGDWWIHGGSVRGQGYWNDDKELSFSTSFDVQRLADQMALQNALEDDGWEFKKRHSQFYGELNIKGPDYCLLKAPTKPDLLIAIVRRGG